MGDEIANSNNDIILSWQKDYLPAINREKDKFNIKHRRKQKPKPSKVKNFRKQKEINKMGVSMSKGEVMTHKGKGKYPTNRREKPWFNPLTKEHVGMLADRIGANTGDTIGGHILIP